MKQLGIFAKYWEPGKVKTRLASKVGPKSAADLYRCFLSTLLRRFGGFDGRRVLGYWPAERETEFQELAGPLWELELQADGDLGQRMSTYFCSAFEREYQSVVLIGSDSPTIRDTQIAAAFDQLREHELVLGPCADGGYYLIGGGPKMPDVFSRIPWSTPRVWSATVERLKSQGANWKALATGYDVDDEEGLKRLKDELQAPEFAGELWKELRSKVSLF